MEKKDWKQKWKIKNSGTAFGLCLVGVAAFSVLFATGQVKQAQREKEQIAAEQLAQAEQAEDGILPEAPDQEGLAAARSLEEMSEGMEVSASDEVTARMEEEAEPVTETEPQTEAAQASAGENLQADTEVREAQSQDILPALEFGETDTLTWPVAGSVVLDYSMDGSIYFPTLNQYKYNPALVIGAGTGSQVAAAAEGIVESIYTDDETGTTLTMDIGNGYQLTYGQLTDLVVSEGQLVEEGALIGCVAEPTKYYCVEGSNLFFEMTKDGVPVDPVLYLE